MSLDMDGTLDFVCFELERPDNLNLYFAQIFEIPLRKTQQIQKHALL